MAKKTCNNCACNKVCNHDVYGFENCGNFISAEDVVKVVHGEWVYCPETITLRSHFYCSACKVVRFEHYTKNNFKYCPNCGAKMDGERKDCDEE